MTDKALEPAETQDFRDVFAVFAMNAIITKELSNFQSESEVAARAYRYADAMLTARRKQSA